MSEHHVIREVLTQPENNDKLMQVPWKAGSAAHFIRKLWVFFSLSSPLFLVNNFKLILKKRQHEPTNRKDDGKKKHNQLTTLSFSSDTLKSFTFNQRRLLLHTAALGREEERI